MVGTALPARLPRPFRRPVLVLLAAGIVVAATYSLPSLVAKVSSPPVQAGAVIPANPVVDPNAVALPGGDPAAAPGLEGRLSLDDRIAFWTARVQKDSTDAISMIHLVAEEMAKARLTADLELYQRAGQVLDRAATIAPGYKEIPELRASLDYTLHDFGGATQVARPLADADPPDIWALGVLADSLVELGRYTEAGERYDQLAQLAPGPGLDTRLARFAYLTGDPVKALEHARAGRDAAVVDPTLWDAVFYQYQLGEIARLTGHPNVAAEAYAAALATRPRDLASLIGMARVDAAAGRTDRAIARLRDATAIAPQAESMALLGDLLSAEGRTAEAGADYDTVRAIRSLSDLASSVYDRQLLLFELDHGGASEAVLARATAALAQRPDPFGWDVVAWADYRLGRYTAAEEAMTDALADGCGDARLLYHDGAIRLALGDRRGASALLAQALALGPALDPAQRSEAERLLDSPGAS
jgi:tetratricopeptide (TPR) repeat protein